MKSNNLNLSYFSVFAGYLVNPEVNQTNTTCHLVSINVKMGITAIAFTMAFLTIVGNALVVIVIAVDPYKELKSIPNYLILNLAVCGLFFGCSEALLGLLHFYLSSNLQVVAYTLIHSSLAASALVLLALAVERYLVVADPFQSNEHLIYSHLILAIVCIWLTVGCVALLSVLNKCNICMATNHLIVADGIGIPSMLAMIAIYLRIFCLVRRCIRRDLEQIMGSEEQSLLRSQNQMAEGIRRREREVAFSVFLFVGVFLLCWAPGILMSNVIFCISGGNINKEPKTAASDCRLGSVHRIQPELITEPSDIRLLDTLSLEKQLWQYADVSVTVRYG